MFVTYALGSMANFKVTKKKYWQYYKQYLQGEIINCKILKAEVRITRRGWDHITSGSKAKSRNMKDALRRMKMLKKLVYIIKNADTFETTSRDSRSYYSIRFSNSRQKEIRKIKVVLRKDSIQKYTFFSIM